MHQAKKGNSYFFGMKAPVSADAESGLVHPVHGIAANVAAVASSVATRVVPAWEAAEAWKKAGDLADLRLKSVLSSNDELCEWIKSLSPLLSRKAPVRPAPQ